MQRRVGTAHGVQVVGTLARMHWPWRQMRSWLGLPPKPQGLPSASFVWTHSPEAQLSAVHGSGSLQDFWHGKALQLEDTYAHVLPVGVSSQMARHGPLSQIANVNLNWHAPMPWPDPPSLAEHVSMVHTLPSSHHASCTGPWAQWPFMHTPASTHPPGTVQVVPSGRFTATHAPVPSHVPGWRQADPVAHGLPADCGDTQDPWAEQVPAPHSPTQGVPAAEGTLQAPPGSQVPAPHGPEQLAPVSAEVTHAPLASHAPSRQGSPVGHACPGTTVAVQVPARSQVPGPWHGLPSLHALPGMTCSTQLPSAWQRRS